MFSYQVLPFTLITEGVSGKGKQTFFGLIDKVCVSFFLSLSKHFCSGVWCMFVCNIVNKKMETQGSGKRSV